MAEIVEILRISFDEISTTPNPNFGASNRQFRSSGRFQARKADFLLLPHNDRVIIDRSARNPEPPPESSAETRASHRGPASVRRRVVPGHPRRFRAGQRE